MERGMARAERDAACQEHDVTQQQLKREGPRKLDAKNASAGLTADLGQEKMKVLTLDQELAEARKNLKADANEHGMLCAAIGSYVMTSEWCRQREPARWRLASSTSRPERAHLRGMPSTLASTDPS
jgi:hypothetical protein